MLPEVLTSAVVSVGMLAGPFARLQRMLEHPQSGMILRCAFMLAAGAVGIYLMLPRGQQAGRRFARYVGGALATLTLVLLVTVPVERGRANPVIDPEVAKATHSAVPGAQQTVLWELKDQPPPTCWTFHILAVLSLASAVMMITSRNPVYSALWFSMVLLGNSGLYLLQGAEFLSAATIIVYAGAIVVTFLFVIMLAQPTGTAGYDRWSREPVLSSLTGLILASALVGTLHHTARMEVRGGTAEISALPATETIVEKGAGQSRSNEMDHVAGLGRALFVEHMVSVEVIGVLLLAAVVGAMLIAGHPVEAPAAGTAGGSRS